jgi:trehalose-6-phosphatase
LKKNRLFFKDFDGSIIEVPQRKIVVAASDLKKIKRLGQEGGATIHGDGS